MKTTSQFHFKTDHRGLHYTFHFGRVYWMKIVQKNVIKKDSISSEPLYLAKQRSKLFCGLPFFGFCGFLRGLQIKIILPSCAFRRIDNNQQLPQFQAGTTYRKSAANRKLDRKTNLHKSGKLDLTKHKNSVKHWKHHHSDQASISLLRPGRGGERAWNVTWNYDVIPKGPHKSPSWIRHLECYSFWKIVQNHQNWL